jgi:predicted ATP-dependent endonuclease of OLD family
MKIRRLRLKNFRKISSVPDPTIELNPDINVLVGANNTGKTSIIHAIQILLNSAPITPERWGIDIGRRYGIL